MVRQVLVHPAELIAGVPARCARGQVAIDVSSCLCAQAALDVRGQPRPHLAACGVDLVDRSLGLEVLGEVRGPQRSTGAESEDRDGVRCRPVAARGVLMGRVLDLEAPQHVAVASREGLERGADDARLVDLRIRIGSTVRVLAMRRRPAIRRGLRAGSGGSTRSEGCSPSSRRRCRRDHARCRTWPHRGRHFRHHVLDLGPIIQSRSGEPVGQPAVTLVQHSERVGLPREPQPGAHRPLRRPRPYPDRPPHALRPSADPSTGSNVRITRRQEPPNGGQRHASPRPATSVERRDYPRPSAGIRDMCRRDGSWSVCVSAADRTVMGGETWMTTQRIGSIGGSTTVTARLIGSVVGVYDDPSTGRSAGSRSAWVRSACAPPSCRWPAPCCGAPTSSSPTTATTVLDARRSTSLCRSSPDDEARLVDALRPTPRARPASPHPPTESSTMT